MAVPKSRKSKSRRDMRRAHVYRKVKAHSLSSCSRCGEQKLPHRVCVNCGTYKDREVIKMEA